MKNNLLGGKKLSCSFYFYRFRKYVSYGFPIINFFNPGVHYETPCIYMYVCTCVYIYIHIRVRVCISMYVCVCFRTRHVVKMCSKMEAWLHTFVNFV